MPISVPVQSSAFVSFRRFHTLSFLAGALELIAVRWILTERPIFGYGWLSITFGMGAYANFMLGDRKFVAGIIAALAGFLFVTELLKTSSPGSRKKKE